MKDDGKKLLNLLDQTTSSGNTDKKTMACIARKQRKTTPTDAIQMRCCFTLYVIHVRYLAFAYYRCNFDVFLVLKYLFRGWYFQLLFSKYTWHTVLLTVSSLFEFSVVFRRNKHIKQNEKRKTKLTVSISRKRPTLNASAIFNRWTCFRRHVF